MNYRLKSMSTILTGLFLYCTETIQALEFDLDKARTGLTVSYNNTGPNDLESIQHRLDSFLQAQSTQNVAISSINFRLDMLPVGNPNRRAEILFESLSNKLPQVTKIDAEDNRLGSIEMHTLCKSFPNLTSLNVANNPLTKQGMIHIGRLGMNELLTSLNISNTEVDHEGIRYLQQPELQKSLDDLNVSHNPRIGTQGLTYIAEGFRNLSSLNLSNLNIVYNQAPTGNQVLTFLPQRWKSPYLTFLNISNNPIDCLEGHRNHPYLKYFLTSLNTSDPDLNLDTLDPNTQDRFLALSREENTALIIAGFLETVPLPENLRLEFLNNLARELPESEAANLTYYEANKFLDEICAIQEKTAEKVLDFLKTEDLTYDQIVGFLDSLILLEKSNIDDFHEFLNYFYESRSSAFIEALHQTFLSKYSKVDTVNEFLKAEDFSLDKVTAFLEKTFLSEVSERNITINPSELLREPIARTVRVDIIELKNQLQSEAPNV